MEWNTKNYPTDCNENEVDVWKIIFDFSILSYEALNSLLSEDEIYRANRLLLKKDYLHFIASRAFLRLILGLYTKKNPQDLKFVYNDFGKPYLIDAPEIEFNLSHSHEMTLYAFTKKNKVGIDLEYENVAIDINSVIELFFSDIEKAKVNKKKSSQKYRAFLEIWTQKEAFSKAHGKGLSSILEETFAPFIFIHSFVPEQNFIASLCIEGQARQINYFQILFPYLDFEIFLEKNAGSGLIQQLHPKILQSRV